MSRQLGGDDLLVGAVLSLRSAKQFLRDAILLYESSRLAGSCILGTVALEHLGQYQWLYRQYQAKKNYTSVQLKAILVKRDHEQKVRDGLVSLQYSAPANLTKLFAQIERMDTSDPAYSEATTAYSKAHKAMINRAPAGFHELRTAAQYVEVDGSSGHCAHPAMSLLSASIHCL